MIFFSQVRKQHQKRSKTLKRNSTNHKTVFGQWENKNFSIFNSIGKTIKITSLVLAYFMFSNFSVVAQEESLADTITLSEIPIAASRTVQLYSETARVVSIIDSEELANIAAQTLDDLLEYVMNVDVRKRGALGIQSDVSIRGGSFEQTLILLNGVKMNDPQTGHHSMNLPIDFSSIERIEILEGAASRIYGANAFSGAINIITGSASTHDKIALTMVAGEHSFYNGTFSASLRSGDTQSFLSINKKQTDGYAYNTDFNTASVFYQFVVKLPQLNFDLQAGYFDKAFGANSFYSPAYPDQFEQIKTTFISSGINIGTKNKLKAQVYWRQHQDRFELFRQNPANWYMGHNYHQTHTTGVDLNTLFRSRVGQTALGLEFRNEHILSNKLGEPMTESIAVPNEPDAEFTHSSSNNNCSLFAEHQLTNRNVSVSAGGMLYYNSVFGFHPSFGVDASYRFVSQIRAFASVNQSMRMPTFTDLYYEGTTNLGNPDLKPESALTIEAGVKTEQQAWNAKLAIFRRFGSNIIDWVRQAETDKWQSQNLTELTTSGIEATVQFDFRKMNIPNLKKLTLNYAYLETDKNSNDWESNYALDYLQHNFSLRLHHQIYKNITASWQYQYQDRAGTFRLYDNEKQLFVGETEYLPYSLVDFRITWQKKQMKFFSELSNVFGDEYFDIGNIEMPKKWLKIGLKIDFLLKNE